jgi:hypothetical protein
VKCEECGAVAEGNAEGWRAYRGDEPDEREPLVVFFCPICAEKEFGPACARPDAHPGYHVKDKLENRLHALVCSGSITLASAQRRIAANWQALYKSVFGSAPA